MSPEFLRRADRAPASNDPFEATARTIQIMCSHVAGSVSDPVVQSVARDAVRQFRGGPEFAISGRDAWQDSRAVASSVWWWVKSNLKFVHHSALLLAWFGEDQLQLLISPDVLLRSPRMVGDCAIYSELVAALLVCNGVGYEFVTVAVNPAQPEIFSHVFVYAVMPDGRRIPLDASHGDYPGWQVPAAEVSRIQVWSSAGNPVADRGSRFDGLHGYGLGDESAALPYFSETGAAPWLVDPAVAYANSGYPAPTAAPGVDWGSLIGNQLSQWTKIAGNVIAPQTTLTRGPNGQLMYSAPASSPSSAFPTSLLAAGESSSLLLYGGLAVAALLLFSSMKK